MTQPKRPAHVTTILQHIQLSIALTTIAHILCLTMLMAPNGTLPVLTLILIGCFLVLGNIRYLHVGATLATLPLVLFAVFTFPMTFVDAALAVGTNVTILGSAFVLHEIRKNALTGKFDVLATRTPPSNAFIWYAFLVPLVAMLASKLHDHRDAIRAFFVGQMGANGIALVGVAAASAALLVFGAWIMAPEKSERDKH